MDLMELEGITATVGGIADLLGALYDQNEAAGLSSKGLFVLYTQTFDAADKLEKLVKTAYAKEKGANVA